MKLTPDCIPCLLRQTLETAKLLAQDPWLHRKVLSEAMAHLQKADLDRTPAELVAEVARIATKALGSQDAYAQVKEKHRLDAKGLEEKLRARVLASPEPLREAARLSAAANAVDGAVFAKVVLADAVGQLTAQPPAIDDGARLAEDLAACEDVLFLPDNVGELHIDKLLLEQLVAQQKKVTLAVRRASVLNEATFEDASGLGLDERIRILDLGTPKSCGLPLMLASGEAREVFEKAGLVIAKGAAAYETLEAETKRIYFLLRAKCGVVARHLGVKVGDTVVYRH